MKNIKKIFKEKIQGKFGICIDLVLFFSISYLFFYFVEDKPYVDSHAAIALFLWIPATFFFIHSLYLLQKLNSNKNIGKEM